MNIEQTAEYIQPVLAHPIAPAVDLPKVTPPPLENGDRLTRSEFERRYDAMPHIKKAELIEGVVYMASPVRVKSHGEPHARIVGWLGVYCASTPGVDIGNNATVRLDMDNEVQPDVLLRIEPAFGGNSRIDNDGYVEGAPELILEVAHSSAAYDLHDKLKVYRRTGVKEYIVWQTYENRLDWLKLYEGEYLPLKPDESGVAAVHEVTAERSEHSEIFPGLDLAAEALLKGDLAKVLSELQKGIETSAHAAFVERLLGEQV